MAIAALSFDTPATVPDAPASGKKLFLGADGRFFLVLPDGTQEPLRAEPAAHNHEISEISGLQDALGNSRSTFVGPTPPSPVVNGTIWVNSENLRPHVLVEGVWAEISTV